MWRPSFRPRMPAHACFGPRLTSFVLLHTPDMFLDTAHPVGLALFTPQGAPDVDIYYDAEKIGSYATLAQHLPPPATGPKISFNRPDGNLGFVAFDSTRARTIRFCAPQTLGAYEIKGSSRFITKLAVDGAVTAAKIAQLNKALEAFRTQTQDFFLTPFKGLRRDGRYRRRMDFALAKAFVAQQFGLARR